jgi:hypothetical protein
VPLFAQTEDTPTAQPPNRVIAVHPLFGDEGIELLSAFNQILFLTIPRSGGSYISYPIDIVNNRPQDVPEGGFPPWICPSPSITNGASYAITGEVGVDNDFPGNYRLRVYLWQMDGTRLLVSDELTAATRAAIEASMPAFLEWILSHIGRNTTVVVETVYMEGEVQTIYVEQEAQTVYVQEEAPQPEHWLFLGGRIGGGSSDWYFYENKTMGVIRQPVTLLYNVNVAFQASVHLMRFLDIQTELLLSTDFKSTSGLVSDEVQDDGVFSLWSLQIPLLAKFTLNAGRLKAGVYGGIYFYVPLFNVGDDRLQQYFSYTPDQPGFMFGLSLGWKLGPGHLFLDGRYSYDGHWINNDRNDAMYYRQSVKVSLGYEWGLIRKNEE